MKLKIDLYETNIWFRHESAMQNEGKGGFIKGNIGIEGLSRSNYSLEKIEISLASEHDTKLHCNLLRIGGKYFRKNGNGGSQKCFMSPSSYKVTLIRDRFNKLIIDTSKHGNYLTYFGSRF